MELEQIFTDKISESLIRLDASSKYVENYQKTKNIIDLESSVLQLRKALECIVFSTIAPNVEQYKAFRAQASQSGDFTKDYHGGRILNALEKINPDFYPIPYGYPEKNENGEYHMPRRENAFPKKSFEKLYDRLGKFLHADNPWGNDKGYLNIAMIIPNDIVSIKGMLNRYISIVRGPDLNGAWLVEIQPNTSKVTLFKAVADGDFVVDYGNSK